MSMARHGRGHWPKWRWADVEAADVVLQELAGVIAGVGEVAGRGKRRGRARIHGGAPVSARCLTKCRHHDEKFGLACLGCHASEGDV